MSEVVTQEQLDNFVMPKVEIGTTVAWYATGKSGSIPQIGFVIRCMPRSVHILTATSGVKEAVRHLEDPKLKLNPEQRETGAWDFTDETKALRALITSMDERIKALEKSLAAQTVSAARGEIPTGPLAEYQALKKRAVDLGIDVKGNPSRQWLEDQLKEASE